MVEVQWKEGTKDLPDAAGLCSDGSFARTYLAQPLLRIVVIKKNIKIRTPKQEPMYKSPFRPVAMLAVVYVLLISSCQKKEPETQSVATDSIVTATPAEPTPISAPLITGIYTADPSAHLFDGKIYVYPSHDIESNVPQDDEGGHFDMKDYHILSMDSIGGEVKDNGVALDIKDIPWVGRQLWAPDAAFANGKYYLYFPAKDKKDVFKIGVATSTSPAGPFKAEAEPIKGSYSIDPAVFKDDDGKYYMYFGGI